MNTCLQQESDYFAYYFLIICQQISYYEIDVFGYEVIFLSIVFWYCICGRIFRCGLLGGSQWALQRKASINIWSLVGKSCGIDLLPSDFVSLHIAIDTRVAWYYYQLDLFVGTMVLTHITLLHTSVTGTMALADGSQASTMVNVGVSHGAIFE